MCDQQVESCDCVDKETECSDARVQGKERIQQVLNPTVRYCCSSLLLLFRLIFQNKIKTIRVIRDLCMDWRTITRALGTKTAISGIEWRVVYFRKLLFETNNEKFRVRRVESKKISRHIGENLLQSGLEVDDTWVKVARMEGENMLSIICVKVVVLRKWGDKSTEWGIVYTTWR